MLCQNKPKTKFIAGKNITKTGLDFPMEGIGVSNNGLTVIHYYFNTTPTDLVAKVLIAGHIILYFKSCMNEILLRYAKFPIEVFTRG